MAIQTEGDWKCPKCDGVEFYMTREETKTGPQRITQYLDVRKCAKCDINMVSPSVAKVENSTSGCITLIAVLAALGIIIGTIFSMMGI